MIQKYTLLVTCGHLQRHIGRFREELMGHGVECWVPQLSGQQFTESEMIQMVPEADVLIAGDDPLGASVLGAGRAGKLGGIVRWGIGTDNVDKSAARALGLPVYNTPGMFSNEVADLAMGHVLNLARHIHKMDRDVRAGEWTRYEGTSLSGKTVGIVGLGGIGREVARRARAFGMTVLGYDVVRIDPAVLSRLEIDQRSFETLLEGSDIVIIACNLTPDNIHLFNADAFSRMRRGAMLVNVARGPIVDEAALADALENGQVGAAGLDVFEEEPLPMSSRLRAFDNCLFGTHSGSSTSQGIDRTNRKSVDIALAMLGIGSGSLAEYHRVA